MAQRFNSIEAVVADLQRGRMVIVVDDAEALSVERLEGMATRSAAAAPAKRLSDQGVSLFAPTGKVTFL